MGRWGPCLRFWAILCVFRWSRRLGVASLSHRSTLLRKFFALFRKPAKPPAEQPVSETRAAAMPSWQPTRGPKPEADKTLRPDAQKWLALLPEYARPKDLCATYPRIANRLAMIWANRPAVRSYFDDLLVDKRGGRIGFSPEIRTELARLRVYYETAMSDVHSVRQWKERMAKASDASPSEPPQASE